MSPYSITRDDATKDASYLRDALDVLREMRSINVAAMARLQGLADSIEEQVKPAFKEPTEFGSIVRTLDVHGHSTHWCRTYSVLVDQPWCTGNSMGSWADVVAGATDVEVLRVGVGLEPVAASGLAAKLHDRLIYRLGEALTSERKNAYEKAIQDLEELA